MEVSGVSSDLRSYVILRDAMDEICKTVSEVLHASLDVAHMSIWLNASGYVEPVTDEANSPPHTAALRAFLQSHRVTPETGKAIAEQDNGALVFAALPLTHAKHRIGTIAVAVDADRWAQEKTLPDLTRVTRLIAMMLAQGTALHQLETDLVEAEQRAIRLKRAAEIDPLTNVENKMSFEQKCKARLTNSNRPAALLALDLDGFKSVNDVYGHQFGDQYLKTIAEFMKAAVSGTSLIGRTGGDEFCLLVDLPEAGRGYLNSVIRDLRHAFQRCNAVLKKPDLGGVSIGVCLFPMQVSSFEKLMQCADLALYASKRRERNATTTYAPSMDGMMTAHLDDASDLGRHSAVPVAVFQPIFDLNTGLRTGLEVIPQVKEQVPYPARGPGGRAARDSKLSSDLALQVIETSLGQLDEACLLAPYDLPELWFNVSENNLLNLDFIFDLQTVLTRFDIAWQQLVIEITEDTVMGLRHSPVFNALQEIRQRGGRIALDAFGTGQAGLAQLGQWPVDIVKIDESVVQVFETDEGADIAMEALIMVAQKLRLCIVAEGIQALDKVPALRRAGCMLGQGGGLAKPVGAPGLARAATAVLID